MRTSRWFLTVAASAATGFVLGLIYRSEEGAAVRADLAERTRPQTEWLQQRLHRVEERVHHMEDRLGSTREFLAARLGEQVDQVVPSLDPNDGSWTEDGDLVERDLRRMPRR